MAQARGGTSTGPGAQAGYRQVRTIAGKGPQPHEFTDALRGIALAGDGRLHAVGDSQVKVYDPEGQLVRRWDTERPGLCVSVEADGAVWVGEQGQLEVFEPDGRRREVWREPRLLGRVTAIEFAGETVLVADAAERCIRRFDREGSHQLDIGKNNRTHGFLIPNGVLDFDVDEELTIHAANPGKHRVERYDLEGALLGRFGRFDGIDPAGFSGCCNPTNVTLAGAGRVCVTEKAGPRVKLYDREGALLAVVASEGFDPGCKNMDVAVDAQGRVYVVDTVRLQVAVFATDAPEEAGEDGR